MPTFIRDRNMPSISVVTARHLSEKYSWDEDLSAWINSQDAIRDLLPPKPQERHATRPPSPTEDNTHNIPERIFHKKSQHHRLI